jgi:hypothetical protein
MYTFCNKSLQRKFKFQLNKHTLYFLETLIIFNMKRHKNEKLEDIFVQFLQM